ncbi:PucR family transcriptional regulator [Paenarthrobacter nitroguajacolicus]|uniref:PucR family transcriptional regulator n=1 Tax=Paenarthrobacter nitroguajacolicus TaxID=211146 RepID=UPI000B882076|nr:helix-turn-helix domain-containing protein [Paenarthrobacter nitroguajacolicus]
MPFKPQTSLPRILSDLGDTLLELVAGRANATSDLGGITIYDRADELSLAPRAVVLGVGVHDPEEIVSLLRKLGEHDAAALIVRSPVDKTPDLLAAVRTSGVLLLGLTEGASWSHVAAMLRVLLAEDDVGDESPQTLGGMPSGDLFALANAIAALLDAPVTIEDRGFNVLAFSGRQDEGDPSRIETILGRQVPQRFADALNRSGIIGDLYKGNAPVYLTPDETDAEGIRLPRVAVAVKAGDEILGSIWAVVSSPLNAERTQAFVDAAKLVSLHLLRNRVGADVERRVRAELMSTALEGGAAAPEAVARLGLLGQKLVVIALGLVEQEPDQADTIGQARFVAERHRVADALAMHLSAIQSRSAVSLIGDVAYGILPMPGDPVSAEERAARVASAFLARTGSKVPGVIGVGPLATDISGLHRSQTGADRALRVLLSRAVPGAVASIADVQIDALLLELGDMVLARGDEIAGPIARLVKYDAEHSGQLLETLQCWLDAFGDVAAASAKAFVHTNTFRYRLKRVAEVGGIDLSNPDERLALMLQLRLMASGIMRD